MVPLFQALSDDTHIGAIKMYLDIISSSLKAHSANMNTPDVPVTLKQGLVGLVLCMFEIYVVENENQHI